MSIKIPDLRFEQSFMRSLEKNALSSDGFELEAKTNKKNHHHKRGTNDDTNDGTNDGSMKPIKAVITPNGKVDLTFGSALDIFGGELVRFKDCCQWNKNH
ncbi:hypothetical protein PACTADRAFT_127 [Pachysolen tannophilus NRRL Y-2460]|uniref:Uncharacterized protein n=1 Tax=Pachysolen tannophilus NRRL Y-2460 TaxID=669874 RepID=A0A1E4U0R2_PACTA|nr:hypothetical protein PACTADRAFT_127 [Pachysolen tannophilus NRRL Y-2460]